MEGSIKMWEKAWPHHGKTYHADAYEEEEDEDNAPPESTSRPEGVGGGPDEDMNEGPPEPPMAVSPVS